MYMYVNVPMLHVHVHVVIVHNTELAFAKLLLYQLTNYTYALVYMYTHVCMYVSYVVWCRS